MKWPFGADLPEKLEPSIDEVRKAFAEVKEDLTEDLPAEVRSWTWRHTAAMAFTLVVCGGGLVMVGMLIAAKPDKPRYVVSLSVHNSLREQLTTRDREALMAEGSLKMSERSIKQLQAQLKDAQAKLAAAEVAQTCTLPDTLIDQLNRKAASR